MATGTGKTYTAFQIIWRLWKSKTRKRILFRVDRKILADQARTNDFKPFGQAMTRIVNRQANEASPYKVVRVDIDRELLDRCRAQEGRHRRTGVTGHLARSAGR